MFVHYQVMWQRQVLYFSYMLLTYIGMGMNICVLGLFYGYQYRCDADPYRYNFLANHGLKYLVNIASGLV